MDKINGARVAENYDPKVDMGHYVINYTDPSNMQLLSFYPRDVYVSAVLATATWLAGCLLHADIESKRLNLS